MTRGEYIDALVRDNVRWPDRAETAFLNLLAFAARRVRMLDKARAYRIAHMPKHHCRVFEAIKVGR